MDQPLRIATSPTPVTARRAASVLMLRQGSHGLEVFIQHRATTMDFAAGVVVYPGGRVDAQDTRIAARVPETVAADHALRWKHTSIAEPGAEQTRLAAAVLAAAAQREVREETGTELSFEQLQPWANWITPTGNPKRFDTFFYVAPLKAGQEPQHQTTEATASQWISPAELLRAADAGKLRLMSPTRSILQDVNSLHTLEAILDHDADILPVRPIRPPATAGR